MIEDVDLVIVGAGASGRSVAWRMLDAGLEHARVVLLDPRLEFGDDRTWCGYRTSRHPFLDLVTHSWAQWSVAWGERSTTRGCARYPYDHLPSRPFYEATEARIAAAERFALCRGEGVSALEEREDHVLVRTPLRTLRAPLVLDSRPRRSRPPRLSQHFGGLFVEAEDALFDPATLTLMDFEDSREGEIRFFYVLPFDEKSALVESTGISPTLPGLEEHFARVRRRLATRFPGARWRERARESGVIPMDLAAEPPSASGRVVPIGLRSGAARASSGYAFAEIQRQAAEITEALARGDSPRPRARYSRVARTLDAVFLRFLETRPDLAPRVFVQLFERTPSETLCRFLSDEASGADVLRVLLAMPALPMLRAAGRSVLAS